MIRLFAALVLYLVFGVVISSCGTTRPHASEPIGPEIGSPAGTWSGVAMAYPRLLHVELQLAPAGMAGPMEVLSGKARIQLLEAYLKGSRFETDGALESGSVTVHLDDATQTFRLAYKSSTGYSTSDWLHVLRGLQGIYDPSSKRIALLPEPWDGLDSVIVLVPDRDFRPVAQSYKKFNKNPAYADIYKLTGLFEGAPSKNQLRKW